MWARSGLRGGVIKLIPAKAVYGESARRLGMEGEFVYQCQNCNARVGCQSIQWHIDCLCSHSRITPPPRCSIFRTAATPDELLTEIYRWMFQMWSAQNERLPANVNCFRDMFISLFGSDLRNRLDFRFFGKPLQ